MRTFTEYQINFISLLHLNTVAKLIPSLPKKRKKKTVTFYLQFIYSLTAKNTYGYYTFITVIHDAPINMRRRLSLVPESPGWGF